VIIVLAFRWPKEKNVLRKPFSSNNSLSLLVFSLHPFDYVGFTVLQNSVNGWDLHLQTKKE